MIFCLISFFSLSELFPAFIFAYNIGSLVNSLFGVKILNPVPVFLLSRGFNFTLSAIVSCDGNCIDNGDDHDSDLNNSSCRYSFCWCSLFILQYIIIKKFYWLL